MPDIQTERDWKALARHSELGTQMVTTQEGASCLSSKARDASKSLKGLAKERLARYMQEEAIL